MLCFQAAQCGTCPAITYYCGTDLSAVLLEDGVVTQVDGEDDGCPAKILLCHDDNGDDSVSYIETPLGNGFASGTMVVCTENGTWLVDAGDGPVGDPITEIACYGMSIF